MVNLAARHYIKKVTTAEELSLAKSTNYLVGFFKKLIGIAVVIGLNNLAYPLV